jgi:WD40 repeat protein
MKQLMFSFMVLLVSTLSAQKHDYNWLIGLGINVEEFPEYGTTRIDFNNNPYQPEHVIQEMGFLASAISVMSDSSGQLLFYTNGCYLANAAGDTIEGGGLLNYASGEDFLDDCDNDYGYSIRMGVISVPTDAASGQYAIIHKDLQANWSNPDNAVFGWNLYLTRLDMTANDGKGKVISSDIILSDTISNSDLTACKHANGKDWWFMVMGDRTNKYYKFLLQKDTLLGPFVQEIGDVLWGDYDICQATFSPDGKQYARVNPCNGVMLYDFDRATGELSNYRNLSYGCAGNFDPVKLVGVCFSPNSRYLYVSGWLQMYQVDTHVADLEAGTTLLGIYDEVRDTVGAGVLVPQPFYLMANAPDCKIYVTAPNQGWSFHVIHEPDLPAPACNFRQRSFRLPTYRTYNIPNFAHYRLGTSNPMCDSTLSIVSAAWNVPKLEIAAKVYPTPTDGPLHLEVDLGLYPKARFLVYDLNGRPVYTADIHRSQYSYTFNLSHLGSGMYVQAIQLPNGQIVHRERIVVMK